MFSAVLIVMVYLGHVILPRFWRGFSLLENRNFYVISGG
jgi:hypothetical protein